jgi:hypothetical protein
MAMAALLVLSNALSTLPLTRWDCSSASAGNARISTKRLRLLISAMVSCARLTRSVEL